jgi:hypothetical protein
LRYRILALVILVTAVGAYFAASHDEVRADVRIVQAPPTTSASPAPADTASPKSSGSVTVGFTLFGGRLYLVSTSDRKAAALPESLKAPTFTCAAEKGADRKFEAWLMRNNGGSGTVPQFDDDGSLLTAPHTGTPLHCALREAPEQ